MREIGNFSGRWAAILKVLYEYPNTTAKTMRTGKLAKRIGSPGQANLSQILKRMKSRGLVRCRKAGRERPYYVSILGKQVLQAWELIRSVSSGRRSW